jgi:hypothetical protein
VSEFHSSLNPEKDTGGSLKAKTIKAVEDIFFNCLLHFLHVKDAGAENPQGLQPADKDQPSFI